MIVHDLNAIFIHVPKTAGNYLTRHCFLQFSKDLLVARGHQDGVNRFEIMGGETRKKHMTLEDYAREVDISRYFLIAPLRDPVERLMSLYYSPHRSMQKTRRGLVIQALSRAMQLSVDLGPEGYRCRKITFSKRDFAKLIAREKTYSDYLKGYEKTKGVFTVRNESLLADISTIFTYFGYVSPDLPAGRTNASPVSRTIEEETIMEMMVGKSRHHEDYRFIDKLSRYAINDSEAA